MRHTNGRGGLSHPRRSSDEQETGWPSGQRLRRALRKTNGSGHAYDDGATAHEASVSVEVSLGGFGADRLTDAPLKRLDLPDA